MQSQFVSVYDDARFFSSSFKVSIQIPYARRTYRYNYVFHFNFGELQLISKKSGEKRLGEEWVEEEQRDTERGPNKRGRRGKGRDEERDRESTPKKFNRRALPS